MNVSRPRDPASVEYFSWFGYSPFGRCPKCDVEWTDVMFAYDGPHCDSPIDAMKRRYDAERKP